MLLKGCSHHHPGCIGRAAGAGLCACCTMLCSCEVYRVLDGCSALQCMGARDLRCLLLADGELLKVLPLIMLH